MDLLRSCRVHCPYCAEPLDIDVDCSVDEQDYIEDCGVCCRPIAVAARVGADGEPSVAVRREDD